MMKAHLRTTFTRASTSYKAFRSALTCSAKSQGVRSLSSARPIAVDDEHETEQLKPRLINASQEKKATLPVHAGDEMKPLNNTQAAPTGNKLSTFEVASPAELMYMDGVKIPITTKLHIVSPEEDAPSGIWPAFRLMDETGDLRNPEWDGKTSHHGGPEPLELQTDRDLLQLQSVLAEVHPYHEEEIKRNGLLIPSPKQYLDTESNNTLLRAHRLMIRLRTMDDILLSAQRQGRISFYMTCRGEEAIQMGAGSALELGDPVFAQYREQGVIMWRGFTLEQFTNQCFSNELDLGKGRQMPIHYGSRALNYHTISSPLGTQLPQAVGAAYRLKLAGQPNVVTCFFGEGAASTTDFHSALNFAATLKAPVIFFCRNNGYAISTPSSEQYAGDGIVSRAPGYGMAAIRIDGNDVLAVHAAVRDAKAYALEHSAPVLIEAMTYRQGHHSTSDDSTSYRPLKEVEEIAKRVDPVTRMENLLINYGWLSQEEIATIRDEERLSVLQAMKKAEERPKPNLDSLFDDVYQTMPQHLIRQKMELSEHIAKYPSKY